MKPKEYFAIKDKNGAIARVCLTDTSALAALSMDYDARLGYTCQPVYVIPVSEYEDTLNELERKKSEIIQIREDCILICKEEFYDLSRRISVVGSEFDRIHDENTKTED